jgi:hypothetical protein
MRWASIAPASSTETVSTAIARQSAVTALAADSSACHSSSEMPPIETAAAAR